jgi:hypothetical protein
MRSPRILILCAVRVQRGVIAAEGFVPMAGVEYFE